MAQTNAGPGINDLAKDPEQFILGGIDCSVGVVHAPGQSESYDQGYSAQYLLEQVETAKCLQSQTF